MVDDGTIERLVGELDSRLSDAANPTNRDWWSRYLKGVIPFRGVPMGEIRRVVHAVWRDLALDDKTHDEQIGLALGLFALPHCEDKLCGVLALSEILNDALELRHVPLLGLPFVKGDVYDWSTCDWYCVKALGRFVGRGERRERAEAIAAWVNADSLWQRRAAAVTFVNHAPKGDRLFPGFTDMLLAVCARNVEDPARFSQTSVGWTLRELSRAEPGAVRSFVRRHKAKMSREALRTATAKLADPPGR